MECKTANLNDTNSCDDSKICNPPSLIKFVASKKHVEYVVIFRTFEWQMIHMRELMEKQSRNPEAEAIFSSPT